MEQFVEKFIRNENLKLYRRALDASPTEEQRRVLLALVRLLVIEQATNTAHPMESGDDVSLDDWRGDLH
jgi:hypothetical protein